MGLEVEEEVMAEELPLEVMLAAMAGLPIRLGQMAAITFLTRLVAEERGETVDLARLVQMEEEEAVAVMLKPAVMVVTALTGTLRTVPVEEEVAVAILPAAAR